MEKNTKQQKETENLPTHSLDTMAPFVAMNMSTVLTHVGVGMGAASFWRGAWYILDDHLFPDNPALSASTSLCLGTVGMALSQGLVHKVERIAAQATSVAKDVSVSSRRQLMPLKVARFGALYTIAVSCVLVWRGTWLGWVSVCRGNGMFLKHFTF
jgi:hypothetical protein